MDKEHSISRLGFLKGASFAAFAGVAGPAAALCVKTGSTPRTLDAALLVKTLKAQGAFLG